MPECFSSSGLKHFRVPLFILPMKNRYILYARKSSEDQNRQVTSIEDQIIELNQVASRLGLEIIEIITESKSAKAPGRKGFNRMLQLIEKGEADGILCWKLDRLARNPIDHGRIAWMLQQEIIQRIYTHTNEYKPTDNVLMMQVEFGMATQYVRDLNVNIRRGLRQKALRGWNPSSVLPIGYIHNPKFQIMESPQEIIPDPRCYSKVKKLWELLLTGNYNICDLEREGNSMGLTTPRGKPLSKNTYYLIFKNIFYSGQFHWRDENGDTKLYTGKHEPMISIDQFQDAQRILDNHSKPHNRLRAHYFPYRGLIFCGECDGYITAEYIHQVICEKCKFKYSVKTNTICRSCGMDFKDMINPTQIVKKYYRCPKKTCKTCTQKSIEEDSIHKEMEAVIHDMQFCKEFYEWGRMEVETKYIELSQKHCDIAELVKEEKELSSELDGYSKMRATGELSRERYLELTVTLERRILYIKGSIQRRKTLRQAIRSKALENLEAARQLKESYNGASLEEKNRILKAAGYNLRLLDKKAYLVTPKWLLHLHKCADRFYSKIGQVQPEKSFENTDDISCFVKLNPILCSGLDVNQNL